MVRDLRRAWLENWGGRHPGKKFVDGSLQTDEGWKRLVHLGKKRVARSLHTDEEREETLVPCKCSSAVEDFRNQVHRRTHSVDSQPLSPVLNVIAYEQCGHGSRDGTYTWAQQHGLLLTNADLATAAAECQICQPSLR